MKIIRELWPGFTVDLAIINMVRLLPPIQESGSCPAFPQRVIVDPMGEVLMPATQEQYEEIRDTWVAANIAGAE